MTPVRRNKDPNVLQELNSSLPWGKIFVPTCNRAFDQPAHSAFLEGKLYIYRPNMAIKYGKMRFMILREDANVVTVRSMDSSARIAPPNIGNPDITVASQQMV